MYRKLCMVVLAGLVLASCAANDEGRVELRRAIPMMAAGPPVVGAPPRPPAADTIWCITCDADQTVGKDDKFVGGVEFAVDDKVSISLKTVYVARFSEWTLFGEDAGLQIVKAFETNTLEANGEIAIAATVIDATREPTVDPDKVDGRIIFYSDDTLEEQPLNQTNLTVYGPVAFKGGPLYVRFSIYEVDADSEQMKKLLSAVANAGKVAFAPASPVLEVLEGIGSAVAQGGSQSDRVFQYTAIFDGGGGSGDVRHLRLLTGDYVLIRSQNREAAPAWGGLYFDPLTQILRWKQGDPARGAKKQAGDPFKDDTYVVFTVNKGLPGGPFTFEQTLADVEKRLKDSGESVITAALIDAVANEFTSNGTYEVASTAIDRFASDKLKPRERQEAGYDALKILAQSRCNRKSTDPAVVAKALSLAREERIVGRLRAAVLASPPVPPASDPTTDLWPSKIDTFLNTPSEAPCVIDDAKLQTQAGLLAAGFKDPPAR